MTVTQFLSPINPLTCQVYNDQYSIQKVQKETFTNQRETSVCKPIFFSICLLFYIFIKQQPQVTREKWVFCDWLQEVACCQVGDIGYKNLRNANQKQFVS